MIFEPAETVFTVTPVFACRGKGAIKKLRQRKASREVIDFLYIAMNHFNPDSAIPRMKCFCVAKNKAIVGILVIKEAPIITPCVPMFPAPEFLKLAKATGKVAIS